jgi:hypothetical protein
MTLRGSRRGTPNGDAHAEPSRIGEGLFLIERPQGTADYQLGAVERTVLHLGFHEVRDTSRSLNFEQYFSDIQDHLI